MGEAERTRFIDNGGQRVILIDASEVTDIAFGLSVLEEARRFIARLQPDGSHFTLIDTTGGSRYAKEHVDAAKALTVHNRPYVKAAAAVSDSMLHRAAVKMVAMFSNRRIEAFDSRASALAWLATQR